jgi:hypothetical protein
MMIRPVGAELFHVADGQTDVIKLIAPFRSFEKAPKTKMETSDDTRSRRNNQFQRRYAVFRFPWLKTHLDPLLHSINT